MKFTKEELQLIETSLRGTLSRIGTDQELESLIEKISKGNIQMRLSHNKDMNIALENDVPFNYNDITIYNLKDLYETVESEFKATEFDLRTVLDAVIESAQEGNTHEIPSHMTKSGNPVDVHFKYDFDYSEELDETNNRTITF